MLEKRISDENPFDLNLVHIRDILELIKPDERAAKKNKKKKDDMKKKDKEV